MSSLMAWRMGHSSKCAYDTEPGGVADISRVCCHSEVPGQAGEMV